MEFITGWQDVWSPESVPPIVRNHVHPDATSGLIRAERRPINAFELADLERQRNEAEAAALSEQRSLRRMMSRTHAMGGLICAALWAVLLLDGGGSTKPVVSTIAGAVVAIGVMRRSRQNVARGRTDWVQSIAEAKAHPVEQVDIAPLRAWSCGDAWIFDLGGGVGLFAKCKVPGGAPRTLLTWRKARGCAAWVDQSGPEIACEAVTLPSNPDTRPIPAVFALESKDPVGSFLRFEGGHCPLRD